MTSVLKALKNDRPDLQLWLDETVEFPLMVASHERSGTHFLMNSLAQCTHYRADPFLNLDLNTVGGLINLHSPEQIATFMGSLQGLHCASLIKSHHPAASLQASLEAGLKVAAIIRHPAEVLLSYWRWLPSLPWHESDCWADPAALARGIPAGASQRYQERCVTNHFERWAAHAQGWLNLQLCDPKRVALITYADLLEQHGPTMEQLCSDLALPLSARPTMPDRHSNVVKGGAQAITPQQWQDLLDVCQKGLQHYPQLAARLRLSAQGS